MTTFKASPSPPVLPKPEGGRIKANHTVIPTTGKDDKGRQFTDTLRKYMLHSILNYGSNCCFVGMFVLSCRTAGAERERDSSVQYAACPTQFVPRQNDVMTQLTHLFI